MHRIVLLSRTDTAIDVFISFLHDNLVLYILLGWGSRDVWIKLTFLVQHDALVSLDDHSMPHSSITSWTTHADSFNTIRRIVLKKAL